MFRKMAVCSVGIAALFACAVAQTAPRSAIVSDAEIRKILMDRIENKQSVGIVVGVIEPSGRRVVAYGGLDKDDKRPLNGDTIFEIGSISKVFTSLLLADMVQHGQVMLNDPVAKYLPPTVKMPERNGRVITLEDLATHTSGLPRMPTNFTGKDPANPYADYTVEQMYQFLSSYQLTRDIGSQYEYSNLGGGLLGLALARRADTDYETLVRTRICNPLGMSSTRITLSREQQARFAMGHNNQLESVAHWDIPTLAGAGALRSSANDLMTFLAANMGYTSTPLASAMAEQIKPRRQTDMGGVEVGLGWHIATQKSSKTFVWHNGGTGGFRSFIAFDRASRAGVVVLSNSNVSVDDIGNHLLDPSMPLAAPSKEHKEITVDSKLLANYVGHYAIAPDFVLTLTQANGHLVLEVPGQGNHELAPESPKSFFLKEDANVGLTFEVDDTGQTKSLVLHQGGNDIPAQRVQ